MRRSALSGLALLLCSASLGARRQQSDVSPLARDPDRGLDAALRARLALVDATRDAPSVETWAARLDAPLRSLERAWGEDRLAQELGAASWISPDLEVAPLWADLSASAQVRGAWTIAHRARPADESVPRQSLPRALCDWRAAFPGEARLDCEVVAIEGDEQRCDARLRVTASGALPAARLQHRALWTGTWRARPSTEEARGLELVGLRAEDFEVVSLAGHPQGLFADVTESACGPLFREQIAPGLDEWRLGISAALEPGSLGHHGLAVGDVNGDGLEDVYWCRPGGLPNKLLLHAPDDRMVDSSAAAGVDLLDYSSSALLVDLDRDGDVDLLVATGSGLVFFVNDGSGHFARQVFVERSLATSLAAADYDQDGDADVYVCSYVSPYEQSATPVPYHDANNGEANELLRNDGDWRFVDVTAAVGLDTNNRRFSLAAAWEDFDNDGDPDLYVANDFGRNNLYRNDGGRFRDVAAELSALDVAAGMGVAWADVDADGWMDLYVTNLYSLAGTRLGAHEGFRPGSSAEVVQAYRHHAQGNTLLLNGRGGAFRDVSAASGTAMGRWGWGSIFLDLDDDGALDLLAPNGFVSGERREDLDSFFWRQVVLRSPDAAGAPDDLYVQGWRAIRRLIRQGYSWNGGERNVAYLARGPADFVDVSCVSGLDFADDARAAARVDWDGDGDEDLIVSNRSAPMLRLLLDQQETGNRWIELDLRGEDGRTAIGARVELETSDGKRLLRTLHCGEGYLAQSTSRVHFGLGTADVRRVTVRWPDGGSEAFGSPAPGALHLLEQGTGRTHAVPARGAHAPLAASRPRLPAPTGSARLVLPTPLALPRLSLETSDGRPASLLGISMQGPRGTGQPLVIVLWSGSGATCLRELARLAEAAEPLTAVGLQVLALDVDPAEERERAAAQLSEIGWPFARGFASEEALQVLELVQGALRDDARGLALPAAFLVDPGGLLIATYQGRLDPQRLRQDLGLFELSPDERRDACVPFAGRWIAPLPGPFTEKVAQRLAEHGLERPAAEYRLARVETRVLGAATLEYEQGVAFHRQGRLAEAAAHYRLALSHDPGYVLAAQDLAVTLHQQGDGVAARAAYERALALDPGDAQTRCNFAFLLLDLGELERAKDELQALRNLKSDLAPKLEQSIRESEPR